MSMSENLSKTAKRRAQRQYYDCHQTDATTMKSLLAPDKFPALPKVQGLSLAAFEAGLTYKNRSDLMLASMPQDTTVAGVFTKSMCPAAPVEWCREIIDSGRGRAIVCNAGNANAFTGKAGELTARSTASVIAHHLDIPIHEVYLASTGVIGEEIPDTILETALTKLVSQLTPVSDKAWEGVARAIMTTDTFPKGAGATLEVGGQLTATAGIAKGSGMIQPDMATMLSFIFTDLKIDPALMQNMLTSSVNKSFNRITVDSDTSTSDTVLLFATGAASTELPAGSVEAAQFQENLDKLTLDLAHQIVRDGEGATKFIEVNVSGASSDDSAKKVALAVANSPLVKTMVAAEDANWGRIVMAVGKAGEPADRDRLDIWIGDEQCARDGRKNPTYDEIRATSFLTERELRISINLNIGDGAGQIWTCDLTHGYIDINAGYRS